MLNKEKYVYAANVMSPVVKKGSNKMISSKAFTVILLFDHFHHHHHYLGKLVGNCYNSSHAHAPGAGAAARERFTTTPGGERDITVPVPDAAASVSRSASSDSGARVDTADCFEIEDLDDAGWEFVTRPAEPLPNGILTFVTEQIISATDQFVTNINIPLADALYSCTKSQIFQSELRILSTDQQCFFWIKKGPQNVNY